MRLGTLVPIVAAVAAAAVACSDSTGPAGGHSTTISVRNNFFTPSPDTVPPGSVTFSWAGQNHNVTWDTGPTTPANSATQSSGTHQVTLVAGTYAYHCSIHGTASSGMRGTIVVQ
jgi:plastocyanin